MYVKEITQAKERGKFTKIFNIPVDSKRIKTKNNVCRGSLRPALLLAQKQALVTWSVAPPG